MRRVGFLRFALMALCLVGTGFARASVTPGGGGGTGSVTPSARAVAATAQVHEPWDGLIDVDVTVYLPVSGTSATIGLSASEEGGTRTFAAHALTGETLVSSSGVYRVTWDFAADHPDVFAPALRVAATASVASFSPDAFSGNYLVVDLSSGAEAESYSVRYLVDPPAGGWTDAEKTSQLVLRKIPAGTFTMGVRATDFPNAQEQNLHEVTLTRALWAGVFEVTQRQWELVTGTRPSNFKNDEFYATRPVEKVNYGAIRGASSDDVGETTFLGLLRARTGETSFDLPTEAEWEYVCRAGTTTGLNSGTNLTNRVQDAALDELARYGQGGIVVSASSGIEKGTAPVGSYAPNAWGLYDLHGNVWEWTRDWYEASLGTTSVTNPAGPATGTKRVLRGGAWNTDSVKCTSGYREAVTPNVTSGWSAYGLRVFATAPEAPVWEGPTTGSGVAEPVYYDGRIIVTLSEALDARGLVFTSGGDVDTAWVATNAFVKEGTHSAQCLSPGTATRREGVRTVWMETTVTGAGTLTFWWKVDCDHDPEGFCDWDHLAYFVDGVEQARIDGETEWTLCTVTLTDEGEHVIRWEYVKDAYVDERESADVGWVDAVVWTPQGGDDDETLTATIAVAADGSVTVGWVSSLPPAPAGTTPRTYALLAKRKLDDPAWEQVAVSNDGSFFTPPPGYSFFKISRKKSD